MDLQNLMEPVWPVIRAAKNVLPITSVAKNAVILITNMRIIVLNNALLTNAQTRRGFALK